MRDVDWARTGIAVLWLSIVAAFLSVHVYWLDEVRALEFARHGESYGEMLAAARGDGHPFLWFVILRTVALVAGKYALPLSAFAIAAAAMALLIWKSPFSRWLILLFAVTRLATYEYTVMARNYGISMLLMFLFAHLYGKSRGNGARTPLLMIVLVLLTQTNVHSLGLAWALLFYWKLDERPGLRLAEVPREVLDWRVPVMVVASLACFLSVWPTFNDAAHIGYPFRISTLLRAIFVPPIGFVENSIFWDKPTDIYVRECIVSMILITGTSLLFIRRRLAFATYWITASGLSVLFTFLYPPLLRHVYLWIVFILALYWMERQRDFRLSGIVPGTWRGWLPGIGMIMLTVTLCLQVEEMTHQGRRLSRTPESHVKNMAEFMATRPDLSRAIFIANPDRLLEPVPYYLDNPLYLIREQRFGTLLHFTKREGLGLALDRVTDTAIGLAQRHPDRPIVLFSLKPIKCGEADRFVTDYTLYSYYDAAMSRRFCSRFARLADFRGALLPEDYVIYLLTDRSPAAGAQK